MQPIKFYFVVILVIGGLCSARIILKSVKSDGALELDRAAVNLITTCYESGGKAVAVGGSGSETFIKVLASEHIPVALVTVPIMMDHIGSVRANPYRLRVIVMTVTNPRDVYTIVGQIYWSIWWNHMGSFLIIYRTSDGCKSVASLLYQAWMMHMLHATVLCYERSMGIQVFGYNPYTPEAPQPWSLKSVSKYKFTYAANNLFSVFERPYSNGTEICKNLKIDKTTNLSHWPIELLLLEFNTNTKTMTDSAAKATSGKKAGSSFGKKPKVFSGKYHRSWSDMVMTTLDHFRLFVNGTTVMKYTDGNFVQRLDFQKLADLVVVAAPLSQARRVPSGPPFMTTEFAVLTQPAGYMSQLLKLISVVDIYSNIGVCITLIVTIFIFKFCFGHDMVSSILNIVRIVSNTGFVNVSVTTSSRLFVASVLMFTVTMQGIYQGNWASLLTTDISLPNIDTYEDLVESGYYIYTEIGSHKTFTDPQIQGRIVQVKGVGNCPHWVSSNSSVGCVSTTSRAMDDAEEYGLHLSNSLLTTYLVHNFRCDWVLEDTFKATIRKLVEADILALIDSNFHKTTLIEFKDNLKIRNAHGFRMMKLDDLSFAFVILGIGLTCATITFAFEHLIKRFCTRNRIRRGRVTRLHC